MKLKRLHLKAFGPFTDQTLTFNSEVPGLHIIFGPNEAGKSSSLRALKALLYGFPQQTPDNFLHNYDQLRVGGCLENSAGEEICFQRRKKRKADLIDEEGNPLDTGVLAPFLKGLESGIFESLYGIDHDTLVRGGEDILARKGEVGQALFAAGAGISSLGQVIEQFEREALELFKPAGQLPDINKAIKKFKILKKEAREVSLSFKEWNLHQKALKEAQAHRSLLEKERDEKHIQFNGLERLKQAIPELATLKSWQDQLKEVGEVVPLPPDFTQKHWQVSQEMQAARQLLERDTKRLHDLEKKRRDISLKETLLNQADQVDDFHQRLGEYRKGQKDKPERNGMRISLRRDGAWLLQQVRPDLNLDAVETLRPVLSRKKRVQALSSEYEAIHQQIKSLQKQQRAAKQELESVADALTTLPDIKDALPLLQAVKPAQRVGDVDVLLEKNSHEFEKHQKSCLSSLKRMGVWTGDLAQLMELSFPLFETVQAFESHFSKITQDLGGLEKDRRKEAKELKKALTEMKKLAYAGEVPSEQWLLQTRKKREKGWQLLRKKWVDHMDVTQESNRYDDTQPLPDAYETYVKQADIVADRLRREADRVAQAAAYRSQVETLQGALTDKEKEKEILEKQIQDLDKDWQRIWEPLAITPLSPKEMGAWLTQMDKLRFKLEDLSLKEQEISQVIKQRQALKHSVEEVLFTMGERQIPLGEALAPVLILAETVLERIAGQKTALEKLKERQKNAQKTFHRSQEDLNAAQSDLDRWQGQWQKALLGLGLQEEVSPLEAVDLIETLRSCFDKLKEADDLKKRIVGIDRDAAELETELKVFLGKIAPEMLDLPLDRAILKLRTMLIQAQKDATVHEKLSEELDSLRKEVTGAQEMLQRATGQMDGLLAIAKCEKTEELPAVITRFTDSQRLREKISDTEAILAKIGAGTSLEAFTKQANEVNADELPGQISALKMDIEQRIHPQINDISQVIGEEKTKLDAMDGSDKAADLAGKMEQELARIRRLSEQYAKLRIASRILQREIERYREEHQDPVLKIASNYFNTLTLGSFAGLRTDVDDNGEPVLVGVRPDELRLTVEKMSSGTRDQLYLALRIATLECRLETAEPMPFIVDDILINFDDDRSRATLSVLDALSLKNQVILFTHHKRIVEEARKIQGQGVIQIHTL